MFKNIFWISTLTSLRNWIKTKCYLWDNAPWERWKRGSHSRNISNLFQQDQKAKHFMVPQKTTSIRNSRKIAAASYSFKHRQCIIPSCKILGKNVITFVKTLSTILEDFINFIKSKKISNDHITLCCITFYKRSHRCYCWHYDSTHLRKQKNWHKNIQKWTERDYYHSVTNEMCHLYQIKSMKVKILPSKSKLWSLCMHVRKV